MKTDETEFGLTNSLCVEFELPILSDDRLLRPLEGVSSPLTPASKERSSKCPAGVSNNHRD